MGVIPAAVQVRPHKKFKKIMAAYADKYSVDLQQIRFLYDGKQITGRNNSGSHISDDMTPDDLDMEDGDTIEVVSVGAFCHPGVNANMDRARMQTRQSLMDLN